MNELREVTMQEATMIEGGDWMETFLDNWISGMSGGTAGYSSGGGVEFHGGYHTVYKNPKP